MVTVVAAILSENGKVFIAKRGGAMKLGGYWEFPGGKVEPTESHEDALKREMMEEFQLGVSVGQRLDVVQHDYGSGLIEIHPYLAKVSHGTPVLIEHDDSAWVLPSQLLDYKLLEADVPIAERLLLIPTAIQALD